MAKVIDIDVGGVTAKLLTFLADWKNGVTIRHRYTSRVRDSLSGKEKRFLKGDSMKLSVSYDLLMDEADAEELRNLIGSLQVTDRLAIPLWPDLWDKADYEANRRYDPQYVVNMEEGNANVYAAASIPAVGSLTYAQTAPLMFGYLLFEPQISAKHDTGVATVKLTIDEDSPYSHRIGVKDFSATADWPAAIVPNWRSSPVEKSKNKIIRRTLGENREKVSDGQEWVYRYERGAKFLMDSGDIGLMLDFWNLKKGRYLSFTAPAWFKPGTPTAEALHGTASRFDTDHLDLSFSSREAATTGIKLITLPWETVNSDGVELGQRTRLFRFTYNSPTPVIWRYTEFERDLVNIEGTWTSGPFELKGKFTEDLTLKTHSMTLKTHSFSGNPVGMFIPYGIDRPLKLEVYDVDTSDLEALEVVFSGSVRPPEADSRQLICKVDPYSGLWDRVFPRFRIQHRCNWSLYSSRCGVAMGTYAHDVTVAVVSADGLTLTLTAPTAAGNQAANYYARGVVLLNDGVDFEQRAIISSTGGVDQVLIQIDRPLRINGVGGTGTLLPGCDSSYETCGSKYNNKDRFGGFPFLPSKNPSTSSPMQQQGGKK